MNVARASLEELLLDYEDYLRHRRLTQWDMNDAEASAVREVPRKFKNDQSDQSDRTDLSDLTDLKKIPLCKLCGSLMALRTAKGGKNPGSQFWGCVSYPDCKGTAPL